MLFETFRSFFQKYKKPLSLFGVLLTIFFIFGETTFANNDEIIDEDTAEKITKILNFILSGAAIILGLISSLISMFLYPGWVNGTLFGLQDYFREIWILISNVVYFIFAAILIVIAFMNIIGKGEGTWELKQALPKFIVGVLIVPFSWFFVQFILSLTSILTVGVLTLPYDTFKDKPQLTEALDPSIASQQLCTDIIIDLNENRGAKLSDVVGTSGSGSGISFPDSLRCDTSADNGGTASIKEILEGERGGEGLKSSVFGVINIYTYGILRIQNLNEINQKDIVGGIKQIADLLFKIVFDLLFVIVYLLLMVALFLALFVRVIRLWIYMMLSPAFGLLYFFGKSSEGVGSDNAKFSIKEFIALALVPVYVSAALAFGLIFILVAGSGIENDGGGDGKLDAGGFSLTIVGALGDGDSEKSVLAKLIVQIFGIVILWIAVMAALRSSETTRTVVEPIAAFGKSVGELAAKAPTYAPIIPTGAGKDRMSAAGLGRFGTTFKGAIEGKAIERGGTFANELAGLGDNSKLTKSINTLNNTLGSVTTESGARTRAIADEFKAMLHSTDGDANKLLTDPDFKKTVANLGTKLGLKDLDVNTQKGLAISIDKVMAQLDGTGVKFGLGGGQNQVGDIQTWQQFEERLKTSHTGVGTPGTGDVKFDDLTGKYVEIKEGGDVKFKVKRDSSGEIDLVSRTLDGGMENIQFSMNQTKLNADKFVMDDLDEGKNLYKILNNDDVKFKEVLEAAGFEKTDELLAQVKGKTTS